MNVNKKLGRLKQWAGERMGGEIRTNVSDDFKSLESEMGLRYDGIKTNHQAMTEYVKSMSQKVEGGNKEKQLPIAALGSAMATHGEDFEADSEFGQCLSTIGRANERLARVQENYLQKASSTWLESLERSTAQHKELAKSRKKLDDRRLGYDTAAAKMEKTKKDDFRTEEELRSQRAKYEEASEDVQRRMMDIKEMESDSVADLTDFLDAQLAYFEKCRDILLQAKRDWPSAYETTKRITRSRSNTGGSYGNRFDAIEEHPSMAPLQPPRPPFSNSRNVSNSLPQSPAKESGFDFSSRPGFNRSSTFDGVRRDVSPASSTYSGYRMPSDSLSIRTQKSQLRSFSQSHYEDSSASPTYSTGSSFTDLSNGTSISVTKKKPPPPPPPSRTTKPPPPLPPLRTRALQDV